MAVCDVCETGGEWGGDDRLDDYAPAPELNCGSLGWCRRTGGFAVGQLDALLTNQSAASFGGPSQRQQQQQRQEPNTGRGRRCQACRLGQWLDVPIVAVSILCLTTLIEVPSSTALSLVCLQLGRLSASIGDSRKDTGRPQLGLANHASVGNPSSFHNFAHGLCDASQLRSSLFAAEPRHLPSRPAATVWSLSSLVLHSHQSHPAARSTQSPHRPCSGVRQSARSSTPSGRVHAAATRLPACCYDRPFPVTRDLARPCKG